VNALHAPLLVEHSPSHRELAVALGMLADLLESGLPLIRALAVLGEVSEEMWRDASVGLVAAVREGRGLAVAFDDAGVALPPTIRGLIEAGERGGALAAALRRAALHAESRAHSEAAVRSALAYPAVVALAGGAALVVLVGVVLPRFASVLSDLGQTMPPLMRGVLLVADAIRSWWLVGLVVVTAALISTQRQLRSSNGRRAIDRMLLRMPGVGTVRAAAATARVSGALSTLLESGLPLRTSLRFAIPAAGDTEIEWRLHEARVRLDAGETFARALGTVDATTVLATRLVAAGEESGQLPRMLAFVARVEQERADRLLRDGIKMLEPALILGLAGLVGVVAAALLQAVYAVRPA
jgi:type II secretory pathway component PulF